MLGSYTQTVVAMVQNAQPLWCASPLRPTRLLLAFASMSCMLSACVPENKCSGRIHKPWSQWCRTLNPCGALRPYDPRDCFSPSRPCRVCYRLVSLRTNARVVYTNRGRNGAERSTLVVRFALTTHAIASRLRVHVVYVIGLCP